MADLKEPPKKQRMPLNQLISQNETDCGPEYNCMCAIASCINGLRIRRVATVGPVRLLELARRMGLCRTRPLEGVSPQELCDVANLLAPEGLHALLLAKPLIWDLNPGDLLYVKGTGLMNSQMDESDHFVQEIVDSHVVAIHSISRNENQIIVVNPDRRKQGASHFRLNVNGLFTLTKQSLYDIWDVTRPGGEQFHNHAVAWTTEE
jgi:hypothetical protein